MHESSAYHFSPEYNISGQTHTVNWQHTALVTMVYMHIYIVFDMMIQEDWINIKFRNLRAKF